MEAAVLSGKIVLGLKIDEKGIGGMERDRDSLRMLGFGRDICRMDVVMGICDTLVPRR